MSKRKGKKKRAKQSNPHKLNEQQLTAKINNLLSRQNADEAYSLAKVLLERFESQNNISLFQSALTQKIKNMEAMGKSHETPKLIAEAKKRFPGNSLFHELDEHVRIKTLNDTQVLEHFSSRQEIPEAFCHQIADILFFSKKPDRKFIKQHAGFKDVFYVREAFENGYDPVKTPKILAAIKPESPYRIWHLLHKGIQAFLESDTESLELIVKKLPQGYFPAFLISKLQDCQAFLDGKSNKNAIQKEDLEIFKTLCGDHCTLVATLSEIVGLRKRTPLHKHTGRLNWIKKYYNTLFGDILFLLLGGSYAIPQLSNYDIDYAERLIDQIEQPEKLAIDSEHLFLKLSGYRYYDSYELDDSIDEILDSIDQTKSSFFDSKVLKSEVLFHYAKTLNPPGKPSLSLFEHFFSGGRKKTVSYESIETLEEAIEYSDHNPEMHTLLINYYRQAKTKTSVINKAVNHFLTKYPDNPGGFDLAGRIAYDNKTYKKAIEYFSKAKELMPLNRELTETVLDCYEMIIDNRNKSNHHLIDKDLQSAKDYVDPKQKSSVDQYGMLEMKALLKKLSLSLINQETFQQEFSERYSTLPKNDKVILKLVLLIMKVQETTKNLEQVLNSISIQVFANLKPSTYLVFFHHALKNDPETPSIFYGMFSKLTLSFIKQEKTCGSLTINQHFELMLLAITKKWNRSFIAFVCLAFVCFPEHKVFVLFKNMLLIKIKNKELKSLLNDEEIISWICSPTGKEFSNELANFDDIFGKISHLLSGSSVPLPKDMVYEINILLEEFPHSLADLSSFLLKWCDKNDLLDLKTVRKIADIPIRTVISKNVLYDHYERDNGISFKEYERRRKKEEQEEKEWEEEQKREREHAKEQQEMKKRIKEEIENKNEQIDLFDLLDNEEP